MDFASLMSAQISKSQKQSSSPAKDSPSSKPDKYLRKSELEAQREAAYQAEQAAKEAERQEKAEKKRKIDEEHAKESAAREAKRQRLAEESLLRRAEEVREEERLRRKRLGLPNPPTVTLNREAKEQSPDGQLENDIPDEELITKLRALEQPARLFGESHKKRLRRYHKLEEQRSRSTTPADGAPTSKRNGPISTSLEPVAEEDMKVSAKLPPVSDPAARLMLSRRLASWFTLVLREWAIALAARPDDVKKTFSGKAATTSMTQAIDHLKPLYRKLEKYPTHPEELPDDLLSPIAEIVNAAQERRYVDANDGYLKLSIGKAAWPIGVTMVGIHERSAREKLHESDKGKAHIMADEATRKILQSIKRCLSFAQTRWPPSDLGQLMG